MKNVKYALFAFLPSDCEAARQWLTGLYEQGWELSRLSWFPFLPARFVPRTRDDLKYCVDVSPYNGKVQVCPDDYDRMIADSGWELIDCSMSLNVYRSRPGTDPAPIHTDPETARKRLWRVVVAPQLLALLFLLGALVYLAVATAGNRSFDPIPILASNWELFYIASLFLLVPVFCYLSLVPLVFWWSGWKRRPSGPRRARGRAMLFIGSWILLLLLPFGRFFSLTGPKTVPTDVPLLTAETAGLSASSDATRRASVLLEVLSADQWMPQGVHFAQNRYDCRFPWVAGLVVEARLDRARSKGLSPATADLGFDGSWTADGYLLLRQGDVVAELSGLSNLTAPDMLEHIRAALELG